MKYTIKEYLYYLKMEKRVSSKTYEAYQNDLMQYKEYLEKNYRMKSFEDIQKKNIEQYLNYLKNKGLTKTSLSRKLTSIKGYHKYLLIEHKNEIKTDVSVHISHPKKEEHLPTVLSEEEIFKILDSIQTDTLIGIRNKAILELLYAGGLRVSELCDLQLENLHIKMSYITVYGKGKKERIVPIGDEAVVSLRTYLTDARPKLSVKPSQTVFLNYKGEHLSRISIFKLIKTLAKENGISKEISPHTIRHSYATHMLKHGTDIRFIQELLGHEDISTTQIYTHLDTENLKQIYNECHPLAKRSKEK